MAEWENVAGKGNILEDAVSLSCVKCADGLWEKPVLLVEENMAITLLDKSATSVMIPARVTEIAFSVFGGCESLLSVEFGGTKSQFEAIKKAKFWYDFFPVKCVKCTDGEVVLPEE